MKAKDKLNLPENLRYTGEHIWVRPEGDIWTVGISDFAQDQLGNVVFVDLPGESQTADAGEEFGSVESVKAVNGLFMPVSGKIEAVNHLLEDCPATINTDCYNEGWIVKIRPDNVEDIKNLLDAASYRSVLELS